MNALNINGEIPVWESFMVVNTKTGQWEKLTGNLTEARELADKLGEDYLAFPVVIRIEAHSVCND